MHKLLVFLEVECYSQVATGECCYIDDIDVTDKHIYNSNIDVSFEAFDCMVQDKKNTHAFKAYL
jgi:hypothetical protein